MFLRSKASGLFGLVLTLVVGVLVVVPDAPAAAQVPSTDLTATKTAPRRVLAGESVEYTVSVRNNGTEPLFNVTFRDVLPLGVTYAGPTTPSVAGEPQIITNQIVDSTTGVMIDQQTVIWDNVADIQSGDSFSLSFAVDLNDTSDLLRPELPVYVVGSTVTNEAATVYASTDARRKATFDDAGVVVSDPDDPNLIVSDTSGSATTTLTAIRVTKRSTNAPEGELLRGVHDNVSTYTVRVEVTDQDSVEGIKVVDLVPAELEFLADNSTDNSSPGEEYQGSGRLGGAVVSGYVVPSTIETVQDPILDGTTFAGVYTRVEWDLGDLAAGGSFEFPYAAAISLRANALFTGTPPSPASGLQAANLDNNTGAATRELTSEDVVTNTAFADGRYLGAVEPGADATVSDIDTLSRRIEDVRILKSVSPKQFVTGGVVAYSVIIETSEYVDAADIVLIDEIPNGVCPLGSPGVNFAPNGDTSCVGEASLQPSQPFDTVTPKPGGGFTVVFEPIADLDAGDDVTVTYNGRARQLYEGGVADGLPTASGDTFTNAVSSVASTTPIDNIVGPTIDGVTDHSSATQTAGSISVSKQLLPRNVTPRLDDASTADRCPDPDPAVSGEPGQQYVDPANVSDGDRAKALGFRLGDQICFRIRVDFDDFVQTRNPIITDFLPAGTEYVPNSVRASVANNAVLNFVEPSSGSTRLEFPVGDATGNDRYADLGSVFEVVFAAEVVEVPSGGAPVITGNLLKMRVENTAGRPQSFRDEVDFGIAPPPPIQVVKGVADVDGIPNPANPANSDVDDVEVRQADEVTFRIDLTNLGTESNFNEFSVRELDVLDVLPDAVACADITDIVNYGPNPGLGECLDSGQSSGSTSDPYTNTTGSSVIRWFFEILDGDDPDDYALFPGEESTSTGPDTRSLFYTMTIPTPTSVSATFDNVAGLRSYDAFTNLQNKVAPSYVPDNNIDPSLEPIANAPEADDDSSVFTPAPQVSKFVTSAIDEVNNDISNPLPTAEQPINGERAEAVVGEYVTYRYYVDIPAGTTVFDAELTDDLPTPTGTIIIDEANRPAGVAAPSLTYYPDADSPHTATVPTGVTFDPTDASVDFGEKFPANGTSATDQRFEVVISTRVTEAHLRPAKHPTRTNTATFVSVDADGGQLNDVVATARVTIVQPRPTVTKRALGPIDATVVGAQIVTFELVASNANGRPPLHDTWIEDCVPEQLGNVQLTGQGPNDLVLTGNAAENAGCGPGETYIAVSLGSVAPGVGGRQTRRYTAEVSSPAIAGEELTNRAELSGGSLDDGNTTPGDDNPLERVYQAVDGVTLTVAGLVLTKGVDPTSARIGERVEYTLSALVPENTQFFQAAIVDRLPPGVGDIQFIESTCVEADPNGAPTGNPCVPEPPQPSVLTPVANGADTLTGFYFGDIAASSNVRLVRVRYSAQIEDVSTSVAGTALTNTVQSRWNITDKPDDDVQDANYPWERNGLTAEATVTVLEPSLTIAKTVDDAAPEPGDVFEYTVEVENVGTSEAWEYRVFDVVPTGVEVIDATVAPGIYDDTTRTITWTPVGELDPNSSFVVTYSARLAASSTIGESSSEATFTNIASVSDYFSLQDVSGNDARRRYPGPSTEATVTPQFPELQVTKRVVDQPPAYIDEPVTWEIEVENIGAGTAFSVHVEDHLPPNWDYEPNSTTVTDPTQTASPEPTDVSIGAVDVLTWENLAVLEPNESLTITYRATAQNRPGSSVVDDPGVGSAISHTNSARAKALDNSNANGNLDGPYEDEDTASTRIDRMNLAVDKRPSSPPIAGQQFDWTIVVSNDAAADTAVGPFTVTDTLPPAIDGVELVSAGGAGWTCVPDAGPTSETEVECQRVDADDTLAPGASFDPITLTFEISATVANGTVIANTASVEGRTYEDPDDLSDNTDTDEVTVIALADLAITKESSGVATPGGDVTWIIEVTNLGPSDSQGPITVTDDLPDGVVGPVSFDVDPTEWSCTANGTDVSCVKNPLLAVGDSTQIELTAVVDPAVGGPNPIVNLAEVRGTTDDPESGNNIDTDEVALLEPDVTLSKVVDDPRPQPGDTFTYTIELTNDGGASSVPAYNLVVTDTPPPEVEIVAVNDGGVESTGTIRWTVDGPLDPATSTTVSFEARLIDSTGIDATPITNTASLQEYTSLPVGGRLYTGNDDDAEVLPQFPALTTTKTPLGSVPTYLGDEFAWLVTVTNSGGGTAATVDVLDELPVNFEYVPGSAIVTQPSGVTTPEPDVTQTAPAPNLEQELSWRDLGPLDPGQSLTVSFRSVATVDVVTSPGVGRNQPHTNTVRAAATDNAGFGSNKAGNYTSNDATADAFIDAADLVLTKSKTAAVAVAGTEYTWTVEVDNLGPDTAVGAFTITDTLPVATTFVSAVGAGWNCSETAGTVTCTRADVADTLPRGRSFDPVSITVAVPSDFQDALQNTATVVARTLDPDTQNNTDDAQVRSTGEADLQLVKNRTNPTIVAGQTTTYMLDVTNLGPSTSRADITVIDTLPSSASFVSASSSPGPWNCTHDGAVTGGDVSCVLSEDVAAGAAAPPITISVRIESSADSADDIINSATVSGTTTDPVPENNSDTDSGRPVTAADLAIDKQATQLLTPGADAVYRLQVTNLGPSDAASAVSISDSLPAGLTFVGAVGVVGTWNCRAPDPSAFDCDLSDALPAGVTAVVEVTVSIDSSVTGTIINTASVTSPTPDPNPDNNSDSDTSPFDTQADLSITKTNSGEPVRAGETFTWILTVANGGPSDSQPDITVTDPLPDGVEFVSASGDGWSCASSAATVRGFSELLTCGRESVLASGLPAPPIGVEVRVLPDAGPGVIGNTAAVAGTTFDPELSNNVASDEVTVVDEADVRIDKSAASQTVNAGESTTFTLRVTNDGPSVADDLVVSDTLPDGMTVVSAVGGDIGGQPGFACTTPTAVQVRCELATLAVGASGTITIEVQVGSGVADGTVLDNVADVSTATPDPNPNNNTDNTDVLVVAVADLRITKSHPIDPVIVGTTMTFDIAVVNNGPSDAVADVVVVDELPSGFTYVGAAGPWTCAPRAATAQIVDCTFTGGGLSAGQAAGTLIMTVQTDPTLDDGPYTNTASVTSPTDPNGDTTSDDVNVVTIADLAIAKSHNQGDVRIGEEFIFDLAVSNAGPSQAHNVVVTDSVPVGFTVISVAGLAWDCSSTAGQDVECVLSTPLAAGTDAAPIAVTVRVEDDVFASSAAVPGPGNTIIIDNTAVVGSDTADANQDNNTDTDTVVVPPLVDLAITKTHADPVTVGGRVTFTLAVTNNGPTDDTATITVTDELPAGLTPTSAASSDADCVIVANTVTCTKADGLAAGARFDIDVDTEVLAAAFPSVANTASVSTPTDDRDPSNNQSTDPVNVLALVDLAITKTHTDPVSIGEPAVFTLTVVNNGPIDESAVITVIDELPAGLALTDASSADAVCTASITTVTCTKTDGLAVGADFEVEVTAEVLVSAYPTLINTATVSSPTADADPSNDSDDDLVTVRPLVDLAITKTHTDPVAVGGQITYTLDVVNNGPTSDPGPTQIVDVLPVSLTPVSVVGDGASCEVSAQTVSCTIDGPLAVDGTVRVTIVADVGPDAAPSVENTATVMPAGCSTPNANAVTAGECPDTDPNNNTDTDVAVVAADIASAGGGGPGVIDVTDDAGAVALDTNLPASGAETAPILRLAPVLLLVGVLLMMWARRRRNIASTSTSRSEG